MGSFILKPLCYYQKKPRKITYILFLDFHKMELGEKPSVRTAASIFRELCYNYRDTLVAGILVAGWDKKDGGWFHFYVLLTPHN